MHCVCSLVVILGATTQDNLKLSTCVSLCTREGVEMVSSSAQTAATVLDENHLFGLCFSKSTPRGEFKERGLHCSVLTQRKHHFGDYVYQPGKRLLLTPACPRQHQSTRLLSHTKRKRYNNRPHFLLLPPSGHATHQAELGHRAVHQETSGGCHPSHYLGMQNRGEQTFNRKEIRKHKYTR